MKLYQAPLEGITGYIYRNALFKVFGGPDKYFMPFISPYEKRIITEKEIKQLCPENNRDTKAIPQILTTDSKGFTELTDRLNSEYGYEEFNINFGCPSGTVVSKGRGAGTLADTDLLESFLDEIMSRSRYKISVKTRIGLHNKNEFQAILAIYNKYSLEELIVHPRIGDEKYKGLPHMDVYREACNNSKNNPIFIKQKSHNIANNSDINQIKINKLFNYFGSNEENNIEKIKDKNNSSLYTKESNINIAKEQINKNSINNKEKECSNKIISKSEMQSNNSNFNQKDKNKLKDKLISETKNYDLTNLHDFSKGKILPSNNSTNLDLIKTPKKSEDKFLLPTKYIFSNLSEELRVFNNKKQS